MTLYMDVHRNVQPTPEELERAHLSDLEAQDRYGVKYIKYWFNRDAGTICCLVEGPQTPIGGALFKDGSLDTAYRIILFTDIAGSTSLTRRLGDAGAMEVVRAHDRILRESLSKCGGREVKHTGDGMMLAFISASQAVQCALQMQARVEEHNRQNPDHAFQVRIGMSAGEPVVENRDFFGAAVQLARRVCDRAEAGTILASSVVHELCIGKNLPFVERGEFDLKGFDEPVLLYEVART